MGGEGHEWWVGLGWGGGGGAVGFWPDTKSGGGGGKEGAVLSHIGGPRIQYSIVEFMRTGINRQRKRAAIIVKCGPKSYEFINGGGGGVEGGGTCPE